jgi:murein DD-endopeptidase MepM/ murein hydrolase activator NlpD
VSLVAVLLAGSMAMSLAVAPESDGSPARAHPHRRATSFRGAAVVTPLRFGASASTDSSTVPPGIGELRRQEAIADADSRRALGDRSSRFAPPRGSFARPAAGAITGPYGERRRSGRHPGIDFDGATGDPVFAASSGTVVHAGPAPDGYRGYGRMVLIDHGGGVQTLYAHLSRVGVAVGHEVGPGDTIGAIGTTGVVTGSHLHFEVRLGGTIVNPGPWLAE